MCKYIFKLSLSTLIACASFNSIAAMSNYGIGAAKLNASENHLVAFRNNLKKHE